MLPIAWGQPVVPVDPKIHEVITQAVREQLAARNVFKVNVHAGQDHYGDPIFEVMIVVKDKPDFKASDIPALTTRVRRQLDDLAEQSFPIIRIVSRKDYRSMSHASR